MEQKTKRSVKIAVGVGCFVVVMAIIFIVVAAALAGQNKPELYDKRYFAVDDTMYDGAVVAVYEGDYVLVRDNAILSRRYKYLAYSHEDLFFFCAGPSSYGLVNSRGREVRAFRYSDKPLYSLPGVLSPFYIVSEPEGDYVLSIDDETRLGPYSEIRPAGLSRSFVEAGTFYYQKDGQARYVSALSGQELSVAGESVTTLGEEYLILGGKAYDPRLSEIAGSAGAYEWTDNTFFRPGDKAIGEKNGVFLLEFGADGCVVTDVSAGTRTTVPLPAGWTEVMTQPYFPVRYHEDGQFVIELDVSGTVSLYYCRGGAATAVERFSSGVVRDSEGDKRNYLTTRAGNLTTLRVDGTDVAAFEEEPRLHTLVDEETEKTYDYFQVGSKLYRVRDDLFFEPVVEGFTAAKDGLIFSEDGAFDASGDRLAEGSEGRSYGEGLFRVNEGDRFLYRRAGTNYSLATQRDLTPVLGSYGGKDPQTAWIYVEVGEDGSNRFFDRDGEEALGESHPHYDEVRQASYKVLFFGADDFVILFSGGQAYSSRAGDFLWYGSYQSYVFSRDGKAVVATDGKRITTYRYLTGRYREQNTRWFYAGVRILPDGTGGAGTLAKYGFVYTDSGTGGSGIIDFEGDFVTPADYDGVTVGSKLVAVSYADGSAALLDKGGKVVERSDYSSAQLLGEYALVRHRVTGRYSLVNTNGKVILSDISSINPLTMLEYDPETASYLRANADDQYILLCASGTYRILKMPILY